MAKRFNVSIPDALAERMEPFKSSLSLSSLMQNAIEQELIRLTTTEEKRDLMAQFKRAAVGAWFSRLPGLGEALDEFAQSLIDKAANDGDQTIFKLYRNLYFAVKGEEVIAEMKSFYESKCADPGDPESLAGAFNIIMGETYLTHIRRCEGTIWNLQSRGREDFGTAFVSFLEKCANEKKYYLGHHNYDEEIVDGENRLCLNESMSTQMGCLTEPDATMERIYFEALDSRVREMMSPEDIKLFVTDLNPDLIECETED
jgi:hypothetical protein